MKSEGKWIVGFVVVAAIVVAVYFYTENKKLLKRNKKVEEDNLKLILESISKTHDVSDEAKKQLKEMIPKFEKVNKKISNEIAQSLQLIQIGQVENAIEDLVKIIENLLTEHYKDDKSFLSWLGKRKNNTHLKLEYCKIEGKINKVEHDFFVAVKSIRNEEDHELDVNLEKYINDSGLIAAVGGIMKIASLVYPESINLN